MSSIARILQPAARQRPNTWTHLCRRLPCGRCPTDASEHGGKVWPPPHRLGTAASGQAHALLEPSKSFASCRSMYLLVAANAICILCNNNLYSTYANEVWFNSNKCSSNSRM
jgi:hypothetical protein